MTTKERLTQQVQNLAQEPIETYTTSEYIIEFKFVVNSRLEFKDIIVIVATGGPHIEFKSENMSINAYHGNETATAYYDDWREVYDYWETYYDEVLNSR